MPGRKVKGTREQMLVEAVRLTGEALATLKIALAEERDDTLPPTARANSVRAWTTRARRLLAEAVRAIMFGMP